MHLLPVEWARNPEEKVREEEEEAEAEEDVKRRRGLDVVNVVYPKFLICSVFYPKILTYHLVQCLQTLRPHRNERNLNSKIM